MVGFSIVHASFSGASDHNFSASHHPHLPREFPLRNGPARFLVRKVSND